MTLPSERRTTRHSHSHDSYNDRKPSTDAEVGQGKGGGIRTRNGQKIDMEEAQEVTEDEEMSNILSQSAELAWAQDNKHGAGGGGGFYQRHFSRAASPEPEEVLSDEEEGGGGGGGGGKGEGIQQRGSDRTSATHHTTQTTTNSKSGGSHTGHNVLYQLFPPVTHTGPGRYVHPVHSHARVGAAVIGYISTHKQVKGRCSSSSNSSGASGNRRGTGGGGREWMEVKIHWASSSSATAGGGRRKKQSQRRGVGGGGGVGEEDRGDWGWTRWCSGSGEGGHVHHFLVPVTSPGDVRDTSSGSVPNNNKQHGKVPNMGPIDEDEEEAYDTFDYVHHENDSTGSVDVWYEQHDKETGYTYYYNATTGVSQWEAPEWVEEIDDQSGVRCVGW